MHRLPLHISLERKNILIVGGGRVALRKIHALLDTGAILKIVATTVLPELRLLGSETGLTIEERHYSTSDIDDMFLVIAATNNPAVNKSIGDDCRSHGILACIVDNPSAGDCIFPAVLRQGDLTVSVSTGGQAPGYAACIRDRIAASIDHRYGDILKQLAQDREKQLTDGKLKPYNKKILQTRINELLHTLSSLEEA